jgi:hypothetical protein
MSNQNFNAMKRVLFMLFLAALTTAVFSQDTITGWNFPVNSGPDSLNANMGLPGNLGYDLRFEMTDSTLNTIFFETGATTFGAATANWDNGANDKFWSIKFKADGYSDFKLYSKQHSCGSYPGPRDFKLQWRLSGGDWEDIPNGTVVVAEDWITGVIDALPVPITGQGTTSIYIRWLMTSDINILGGTVTATGKSMIDDILVTAVNPAGKEEALFTNRISISQASGENMFNVVSSAPVTHAYIYNLQGQRVLSLENPGTGFRVDLSGQGRGMYFISVKFADQKAWYNQKVVVR